MESGDQPARLDFAEVYRRHADSVYRFCLSQLRDPAAAEDVAADVFAAAFAAFANVYPTDDGVRPWLFRIARNATIDHRRRTGTRFRLLGALRGRGNYSVDVESAAAIRQQLRDVLDAVGRLRERDRQLIGLRVAAGLSYAQIGEVMGIKENAARMATQRAVVKVRSVLEKDDE